MPDSRKEISEIRKEIDELVHRALVQAGDIQSIEEKLEAIVQKTSKIVGDEEQQAEKRSED